MCFIPIPDFVSKLAFPQSIKPIIETPKNLILMIPKRQLANFFPVSAWALCVLAALAPSSARAVSGTWNVDSNGAWSTAGNWNPAAVPGTTAGDIVSLSRDLTAARTVTLDTTSRTVGTLNLGDPAATFFPYTLAASGGAGLIFDHSGSGASLVQAVTTAADVISAPVTLADNLTVNNSATGGLTLSGVIAGTGKSLTKTGSGQLTLNGSAVNSFTGGVNVNAGTLLANFTNLSASPNNNLLDGSNVLTLGGGTLYLNGKTNIASSQTFASTTLTQGSASKITLGRQGSGSMTAALGTITRNTGSILNFTNVPDTSTILATTSNGNDASGLLGPWAIVGASTNIRYATVDGSNRIINYGTGTAGTTGTLDNVISATENFSSSAVATLTSSITANTLLQTGTYTNGDTLVDNSGGYDITLNGLLYAGNNKYVGFGKTADQGGGKLRIGANKELVVITTGQLSLASTIIDYDVGQASHLTYYSIGNDSSITSVNTYSGGTTICGPGSVSIWDPASCGTGPVTVTNGTFNARFSGGTMANALAFNGGTFIAGYANTFSGAINFTVLTTFNF